MPKAKKEKESDGLIDRLTLWDKSCEVPWSSDKTKKLVIVSVDPGLSNCAYAVIHPGTDRDPITSKIKPPDLSTVARIFFLETKITQIVESHKADVLVKESEATQAKFGVALAGRVQYALERIAVSHNIPLISITPQSMRSFMKVGKGDKGSTQLQVFKRYGFQAESFDETDAYALGQTGLAILRGEYVVNKSKKPRKKKADAET